MSNRLYRDTGRVLQRETIVTTRTEWVEDPPQMLVPPPTPPIVAANPPLESPVFVPWVGMGFSPCVTSDGRYGQRILRYLPDGSQLLASDCLVNDGLSP